MIRSRNDARAFGFRDPMSSFAAWRQLSGAAIRSISPCRIALLAVIGLPVNINCMAARTPII